MKINGSSPDNSTLPSIYKIMKTDCRVSSLLFSPSGGASSPVPDVRYRLRRVESGARLTGWLARDARDSTLVRGVEGGPEACRERALSGVGEFRALFGAPVFTEAPHRACRCWRECLLAVAAWTECGESREREDQFIPPLPSLSEFSLFFSEERDRTSRRIRGDS